MGNCVGSKQKKQTENHEKPTITQAKKQEIPEKKDDNVQLIETNRNKLEVYKQNLEENSIKLEKKIRVSIVDGQLNQALFALKQKKLCEKIIEKIEKQLLDIKNNISYTESGEPSSKMNDLRKSTEELVNNINNIEKLEQSRSDGNETEEVKKEFDKLFEEYGIQDDKIEPLFKKYQFEISNDNNKDNNFSSNELKNEREVLDSPKKSKDECIDIEEDIGTPNQKDYLKAADVNSAVQHDLILTSSSSCIRQSITKKYKHQPMKVIIHDDKIDEAFEAQFI